MKIGFDAKRAFHNTTGLGNYSRTLIESLAKNFSKNSYHLYSPLGGNAAVVGLPTNNTIIHHPKSFFNKTFSSLWRRKNIVQDLENDGIEIYHGLSNELPIGIEKTKIKTVVTIHDVIFKKFPQFYPRFDRNIYDRKWKHAIEIADVIVCISEQTKNDVLEFYKPDEKKVSVIYQSFQQKEFQKKETEQSKPFLLSVGRIEERKNILIVLEALALINEKQRPGLIMVGRKTKYFNRLIPVIKKNKLEAFFKYAPWLNNNDLNLFYNASAALVFPSRYEGFGLPVVEAQQIGTPVICSDLDIMRETSGGASLFANADNAEQWKEKILEAINFSVEEKSSLIEKGIQNTKRFLPEIISAQWNSLYQKLLS